MDDEELAIFDLIETSYRSATGRDLAEGADHGERARWCYEQAPFGLLAHDTADDPVFVYANRTAQRCFEYDHADLVGLPSRLSALEHGQEDRDALLAEVDRAGYATGYRGLRRARSGRLFWIEEVTMWNLVDGAGVRRGQAAMFARTTPA